MKTKDLIRKLQEADPSGEEECVVGNLDIHFVSAEPAYYDGRRQELIRDPARDGFYNIIGGRIVGSGTKVQIHTLSIEDALVNHPEMPVELDNAGCYEREVAEWRKQARELDAECGTARK